MLGDVHHPLLSTDFSLAPELTQISEAAFDGTARLRMMMSRWRRGAAFGLLENKLLAHSLLDTLGIPQADVLYGAFATKALGPWPRYERAMMLRALRTSREFVLKSATNGGNADVLVMTEAKWAREGWTLPRVAAFAERWMLASDTARWYSAWGQRYEHRSVIVQRLVADAPPRRHAGANATLAGPAGFRSPLARLLIEVKVHTSFGRLGNCRIQALPFDGDVYLDASFLSGGGDDGGGAPRVLGSRGLAAGGESEAAARARLGARVLPLLARTAPRLRAVARRVRDLYGADWLRLDVFVSEAPGACDRTARPNRTAHTVVQCSSRPWR
jgi:hypothetical protein